MDLISFTLALREILPELNKSQIDSVTGWFQGGATIFMLVNLYRLAQHKMLAGVSLWMIFFFNLWNWWGVYYLAVFNLPLGMLTALTLSITYTVWFGMGVYYTYFYRRNSNAANPDSGHQ